MPVCLPSQGGFDVLTITIERATELSAQPRIKEGMRVQVDTEDGMCNGTVRRKLEDGHYRVCFEDDDATDSDVWSDDDIEPIEKGPEQSEGESMMEPFVKLRVGSHEPQCTSVQKTRLNPVEWVWNEKFSFLAESTDDVVLEVWGSNWTSGNVLIGTAKLGRLAQILQADTALQDGQTVSKREIMRIGGSKAQGELHFSLHLIRDRFAASSPADATRSSDKSGQINWAVSFANAEPHQYSTKQIQVSQKAIWCAKDCASDNMHYHDSNTVCSCM